MTPVPTTATRRIALVKDMRSVLPQRVLTPVSLPAARRASTTNLLIQISFGVSGATTPVRGPAPPERAWDNGNLRQRRRLPCSPSTTSVSELVLGATEARV